MTSAADDLIPENYYRWPPAIQRQYVEELYLLYFGERIHLAEDDGDAQPGERRPRK